MEKRNGTFSAQGIAVIGLMSALVFVGTYLHIDIPTPLGVSMLHFGNVMCLLSALLFGRLRGGLSAGLGSLFYDLIDPRFIAESWVTFIMKFAMAFVAGTIAHGGSRNEQGKATSLRTIVGAVCGSLTYVVLYVCKTYIKNYFILGYEIETVVSTIVIKGTTSLTNGLIAVVASLLLNAALRPALDKAGISNKLGVR